MSISNPLWPTELVHRHVTDANPQLLAAEAYLRVCRTTFDQPGAYVFDFGPSLDSASFRQLMLAIGREMSALHERKTGERLVYLSAARFDQQNSTKPHLDGGPDESLLMLGYEPTSVASAMTIHDLSRCAFDLGMTPERFLERHNPMFAGTKLLEPYATSLDGVSHTHYRIVCINNSRCAFEPDGPRWLGVLHTAEVPYPDETARRIINSTMLAPTNVNGQVSQRANGTDSSAEGTGLAARLVSESDSEAEGTESPGVAGRGRVSDADLQTFVTTSVVHRRGYDKTHLADDA